MTARKAWRRYLKRDLSDKSLNNKPIPQEKQMGILGKDQDTSSSFQPFPAGPQSLEIKATEWKATNAGNGHYLNLEMTVIKGKAKGRKLWHTLNLENPSAEAVGISKTEAQQMIIQIKGKALDVDSIKDLQKILKGGRLEAMVKIQQDKKKKYPPKNVISYLIMDDDQEDENGGGKEKKSSKKSKSSAPWDNDDVDDAEAAAKKAAKKAKKKAKKAAKKSQE